MVCCYLFHNFVCPHLTILTPLGPCNGGGIGCHFLAIYCNMVLTEKVLDEGFILVVVLHIVICMWLRELGSLKFKLHFSSFYLLC